MKKPISFGPTDGMREEMAKEQAEATGKVAKAALEDHYRKKTRKASYVGVPAIFKLELACKHLTAAFGNGHDCYLVGSAAERPDWRDVDVVLILSDNDFRRLFPKAIQTNAAFEHDARWQIMTVAISDWLAKETGLPIDFKFQPRTWANSKDGFRHPLGLNYVPNPDPMPGWEES